MELRRSSGGVRTNPDAGMRRSLLIALRKWRRGNDWRRPKGVDALAPERYLANGSATPMRGKSLTYRQPTLPYPQDLRPTLAIICTCRGSYDW